MNLNELTAAALALMTTEDRAALTALPAPVLAEIVNSISEAWGGEVTAEDLAWELAVIELPEMAELEEASDDLFTIAHVDDCEGTALRDSLISRGYDGNLYTLSRVATDTRPACAVTAYRTATGTFHAAS